MIRGRALTLLVPAFLLASSACGGGGDAGPAPSPSGSSAATSAPPSSAPPAIVTAADGEDASTCEDGRCQILVKEQSDFALDGKFSCEGMLLTFTAPNELRIDVAVRDGDDLHATITGTGNLALAYGLTLTVQQTGPAGAVVKVAPARNDPGNHKGTGTQGFSLYSGDGT
ncbi:hypothetical protein AB0C29_49105 [Actinoplanes sp. NPDC048791]|uniref:hypothetical protein n=1 Tax=Actinoplanes sp. NPDC048791 TaxID=3154623 RepID=UPI0033CAE0BD